jgi:opacity protein-like surface antigen
MQFFRLSVLVAGVCAASTFAAAQEAPQWELSGGYQSTRDFGLPMFSNLSHLHSSGFNFGLQENLNGWFGGVFNFSASYPMQNTDFPLAAPIYTTESKGQLYTFMVGPQFTLRKNPYVQPFVRVLIGGGRDHLKSDIREIGGAILPSSAVQADETGLALGGGAGVDVRLTHRVYARLSGEWVRTALFNDVQNNVFWSAGITYRFGQHE